MQMLIATVMMMMKMMLLPPRILVDVGSMPSMSSPYGSLPEARFCEFLVSLCVGSPIYLHRVEVFDEAEPPTPDTGIDTSRLCPYGCPLKSLAFPLAMAFLPGANINIQYTSIASNLHFILQKLHFNWHLHRSS
jgi:hypothetical protein